ncbi:MAG: peptidylprolyl isomerase [Candidatus Eisenbacteria bacterium]
MTHLRSRALLPCTFVAALALTGCSSSNKPVLIVGDRTITLAEFASVASGNEKQYPGTPEASKRALLDDLERRELLIVAARHSGYDTTAIARNQHDEVEERLVVQALMDQMAPTDQRVSAAEVRRMFEWRNEQYDVAAIYTLDRSSIRLAQAALAGGEPFATVAMRYSLAGMLPPGGALGYITPGQLIAPLDGALRTLPVGRIGGPYETTQGWFLLQVRGKQVRPQMSFELQQAGLLDMLRQRKQRQAMATAFVNLRREYEFQLVQGGSQALYHRLQGMGDSSATSTRDPQTVLAVYRGGEYTMTDALIDLQRPDRQRPPTNIQPALDLWIESMVTNRLLVIEARRRHLHEEPRLAGKIRQQFENSLAESMYNGATIHVPPPGPDDVRQAWELSKQQYIRLESATVLTLVVPDTAMASRISMHGGHSGTLRDAARMADPGLVVDESTVTYPTQDPRWQPLEAMFMRMQPGEWAGPEPVANGFQFIQLVSKQQSTQTFEAMPDALKQQFASNAFELKREARFQQYCDSLRVRLKPVKLPENLARLEWPVAQPLDVGR